MHRSAFTMVELLVVVATVGILVALALPALAGSRRSAATTLCFARLSNAIQSHARFSANHRDNWLNPLPPGVFFASGRTGATGEALITRVLEIVPQWAFFMNHELVDQGESGEAVTCPNVHQAMGPGWDMENRAGAVLSYLYSASLVTNWRLWREGNAEARLEPDRHRAVVATSAVRHPSQKVALFEWLDNHGTGEKIDQPARSDRAQSNVAFADGHLERVRISDARPPLRVAWPTAGLEPGWVPTGSPLPFSSSVDGYRGWDK